MQKLISIQVSNLILILRVV